MTAAPGLYLHLPFCSAICPYCDFAVRRGDAERRQRFVAHLRHEIRLWGGVAPAVPRLLTSPFDTIYLGGGTPSLLGPDQLQRILEEIRATLPIAAGVWLAMEANPEDVTPAALVAWRQLGVRTLTLGVQSFDDEELRFLGRRHDGPAARRAVETAVAAGFPSVGIDLIFGLPDQSATAWRRQLDLAAALGAQHLSCYQLTIHPRTPFGLRARRGLLRELPEPGQAELFRVTHEALPAQGYSAYEVSNFARGDEHRSGHNRKYWGHVPYLGLGPSAHSFDGAARWWNHRRTAPWEAAIAAGELPVEGREELGAAALALEHVMLGLRTIEGLDLDRLRRHGCDLLSANAALVQRLLDEGMATLSGDRLALTLSGWAIADGLAASFHLGSGDLTPGDVAASVRQEQA